MDKNNNHDYYKTDINDTVKYDDYDDDAYNQLLIAELLIMKAQGDGHICSIELQWATNSMNQPIGRQHKNTIHNIDWYIV